MKEYRYAIASGSSPPFRYCAKCTGSTWISWLRSYSPPRLIWRLCPLASLYALTLSHLILSGHRERGYSRPPWRYGGRLSYVVWCCRPVFFTLFTDDILLNHDVGLSILGYPGLVDLDPVYCMPAKLIEAKGLRKSWEALPRREA